MSLEDALAADRAGDIEVAAAEYEKVLAGGDSSLRVLLNLTLLYWQGTEFGIVATKHLPTDFVATADRRIPELIEKARRLYPKSTEVRFWEKYIPWAMWAEKLDTDFCRQLLREDPSTLIPAMYLFTQSNGTEAR